MLDNGTLWALWLQVASNARTWSTPRTGTATRPAAPHGLRDRHPRGCAARGRYFLEHGVYIETGPHKHAIQQTFFLYVYEPGGNRVEIANAGARLILAPDWRPIRWSEAERKKGQAWGLKTIESFHTYGTPPVA